MPRDAKTILKSIEMPRKESQPLWKGPENNSQLGGISQSMLHKFLQCRERFRIRYILGLKPVEQFSRVMEYGNMWHIAEEHHAKNSDWKKPLKEYCDELRKKYQYQQEEINKWYQVCLHQFPIYVDYWARHKDMVNRTPLMQEEVFHVPYTLPSGRVVYLKGKFDQVDLIKAKKEQGIWLGEHKTKGEIDPEALRAQLKMDVQTMLYIVALQETWNNEIWGVQGRDNDWWEKHQHLDPKIVSIPIVGVRYNVIRRPLSGGKGTIKPKSINGVMETDHLFYQRLQQYFIEEPGYWFMRWNVEISAKDIENFKVQFLNPVLEQLCIWYDWMQFSKFSDPFGDKMFNSDGTVDAAYGIGIHWKSPAADHVTKDYDAYLETGSTVGLHQVSTLFEELK